MKKSFVHGRCHLCRYFVALPREMKKPASLPVFGECRRFPPTVKRATAEIGMAIGEFLATHENDWCGEFKT